MSDRHLRELVIRRLDQETVPDDEWAPLILAALEGADSLRELLDGDEADSAGDGDDAASEGDADGLERAAAGPAFLQSVTVEGFRGIGPGTSLEIAAGPGLTLVVGRNGCGKSSFAEALELLLTGDTYRWKAKKSVIWREGWRNLHHDRADIRTELLLEGESGVCTVAREWNASEKLEEARSWAQVHGKPRTDPSALGWEHAISSYRPFLSYSELGSLLDDGPSKLYDKLAAILGLEDLVQAQNILANERKRRDTALKDAAKERKEIAGTLAGLDDPRAEQVVAALAEDDWGLDAIDAVLTGGGEDDGENVIRILRRLSTLPAPDEEAVAEAAGDLQERAKAVSAASDSLGARAADLAMLLDHALGFHGTHGGDDCPVCGTAGAVGGGWAAEKAAEADRLRQEAIEVRDSRKALREAMETVGEFTVPDAVFLETAAGLGLDDELADLREAVAAWDAACDMAEPDARAAGVEEAGAGIREAVEPVQARAAEELARREDAWRPVATVFARWVPVAREALADGVWVKDLKHAEDWLKTAGEDIRAERFAPIADQAIAIWEQLRVQSNVTLGAVRLGGRGKRRRVELDVTVDGQGGTALGVMSQGELHSLALSLFIPRATLPESPFRFVVIDDPVQSMDPARVDGLARVLEKAAAGRQVIVFTHDDRLPEAVRRLEIDARVIEVTRREGSVVEVRDAKDPVSRYIEDAMALAYTDGLPEEAARRVVPGLCRGAVEAACMEAVRRRRLGKGEAHARVEAELLKAQRLTNLAALALFDDAGRAGEVMSRINKNRGRPAGDAFKACNQGAHGNFGGVLVDFVRDAEKLAQWLQGLR